MESRFSGVVKISSANDFITASQDCIVSANPSNPQDGVNEGPVKISLKDCLACSGCVTSAETTLLENQSTDEFLRAVKDESLKVAVSISSQARASLSVFLSLDPQKTMKCLIGFFRSIGVDFVFDMNSANDLMLLKASEEFHRRYKEASRHGSLPLNLLASACPGWVCYIEKTHGDWCIPYLSTTRSAQATMGKILKTVLCRKWGIQPGKLYHCTVMSCYDKKLEASRPDFATSEEGIPEVDSCLTTSELSALIEEKLDRRTFAELNNRRDIYLDTLTLQKDSSVELYGVKESSGGLMDFVCRESSKEIELESEDGRTRLRFAKVYGFRNIQSLVQNLKKRRCPYDYVEVMACPSGCTNGGGQPNPTELDKIDNIHEDVIERHPTENPEIASLLDLELNTTFSAVRRREAMDW